MINKDDVTAVILAGGKGRRLGGQDKGLYHYKNKPLIEYVISRIQPQVKTILISANRNQKIYAKYGFPVITDELDDFQGPLAGFITAMRAAKTSYIVTLPCDGPVLPSDMLVRMIKTLNNASTTATDALCVAHNGERLQSVYALIPTHLLTSLEQFLKEGHRKVDRWYARHAMQLVDFSDIPYAFDNINTEEQKQNLEDKNK